MALKKCLTFKIKIDIKIKLYSLVPWSTLNGSFSWTSKAAALIRPCFNAVASASSSTKPPRAVFTRKAPKNIYIH